VLEKKREGRAGSSVREWCGYTRVCCMLAIRLCFNDWGFRRRIGDR
jgi:hypothetical protein